LCHNSIFKLLLKDFSIQTNILKSSIYANFFSYKYQKYSALIPIIKK